MESHPVPPVNALRFSYLALPALFYVLQLPMVSLSQTALASQTTIRVNSSLVLVDVITRGGCKIQTTLEDLTKSDFRVFDDGSEMDIRSFDVGARFGARPVALWIVVICNEDNWDEKGSGFIRGQATTSGGSTLKSSR